MDRAAANRPEPTFKEAVTSSVVSAIVWHDFILGKVVFFGQITHDIMGAFGLVLILLGFMGAGIFLPVTYYGGHYMFACVQSIYRAEITQDKIPSWDDRAEFLANIINAAWLGLFLFVMHTIMSWKGLLAQHSYAKPSIYIVSALVLGLVIMVESAYHKMLWICERSIKTDKCSITNAFYWYGVGYGALVYILTVSMVLFWACVD